VETIGNAKSAAFSTQTHRPYPQSWVDRLIEAVRRLPVPWWLFYAGLGSVMVVAQAATKWSDGTYPFPTFNPYHMLWVLTSVYLLAVMHYIDNVADEALATFRPALRVNEAEYTDLLYRLTASPALPTLLASLVGPAYATTSLLNTSPERFQLLQLYTSMPASVADGSVYILGWAVITVFVYRTIHQLRFVNSIYTRYAQIDIFKITPLFAFSRLTARTAVLLVFGVYLHFICTPNLEGSPLAVAILVGDVLIALVIFVWPLLGVHRLLEEEKSRLQSENGEQLKATITDLHARIATGDLQEIGGLNQAMQSLVIEQNVLDKVPTWPWNPETPRLLFTAILLPIILYVLQIVITGVLKL
jgi:hypothetical protein